MKNGKKKSEGSFYFWAILHMMYRSLSESFFFYLAKVQSFTETGRRARLTIMISSSLLLVGISFLVEKFSVET